MRTIRILLCAGVGFALCGCATERGSRVTNQNAPGPQVGKAVGTGVGAVVGNVVGAGVGVVEGSVTAVGDVFDPKPTRIVRHWKTESTSDGRTIEVPVDYLVDEQGRVIKPVKPGTGFR